MDMISCEFGSRGICQYPWVKSMFAKHLLSLQFGKRDSKCSIADCSEKVLAVFPRRSTVKT